MTPSTRHLAGTLISHAAGLTSNAAAAELTCAHQTWLTRTDFTATCIHAGTETTSTPTPTSTGNTPSPPSTATSSPPRPPKPASCVSPPASATTTSPSTSPASWAASTTPTSPWSPRPSPAPTADHDAEHRGLPEGSDHVVPDVSFVADPVLRVHRQQYGGFFPAVVVVAAPVDRVGNPGEAFRKWCRRPGRSFRWSCVFLSTVPCARPMTSMGAACRPGCTGHPGQGRQRSAQIRASLPERAALWQIWRG